MRGVIWAKVWHDLWHHRVRSILTVLSIAAGVFAIGTIFGLVDQLLSGMDAAHRAVMPSHINAILRGTVDAEVINNLQDLPGMAGIDPVNQLSVRYKAGADSDWRQGFVVMRPDYGDQTYDMVVLRDGQWPRDGQIGIERLSGQHFGVAMGDEVIFEIDGQERAFAVNGMIRHPFVEPPPFGGQAHFFLDAAGLAEFGIPEGRYGQLLVRVQEPYSLERAQDLAADLRASLSRQGVGVIVILYQDPARHWGRMFVEGVTVVLQIMAAVSLFLSVLLVLVTSTAMITQQTDQIGVLKAIGGRRSIIIGLYMVMVLIFGLLALLVALPLGSVTAFLASRWFLNLFNIDYDVLRVSMRGILLQAGAALLAPAAAALYPILKGAAITVREALATYGLGSDFGSSRLDQLVEAIGSRFLSTPYATALGNMFRRKERLSLTLLVLTTAGVMFLVVMTLVSSVGLTLDNEMQRRGYDVRIGFAGDQTVADVLDVVGSVAGVESAEMWISRNATILREGVRLEDSAGLGAQLVGVVNGSTMLRPIIMSGRWLQPGDDQVIVINQETADKNDIQVGDMVNLDLGVLGNSEWQVAGTYKVIYRGGFDIEAVYAPMEAVLRVTGLPQIGTQVLITSRDKSGQATPALADEIKARLEDQGWGIDLYTTGVKVQEREYLNNQFNSVVSMLLGLAMLVATVGGIGLAGSLSISVMERRREIGFMRAIGAHSRTIRRLFILEGLLQGILSWLMVIPLSHLVSRPLARLLGQTMMEIDLDYVYNWPAVLVWLMVVLGIATLASVGPSLWAAKVRVHESIAYT